MNNMTSLTREKLEELNANYSLREIGEMFFCSGSYVGNLYRKFGIKKINKTTVYEFTEEELRELYKDFTAKEICEAYGMKETALKDRLRKYGIKKKDLLSEG